MPLSKLHVPVGLPNATCRDLAEALHDSLVATCGVNPDDNFALIVRHDPDNMVIHPTFLGTRNVRTTIIIEIVLLAGRTDTQKDALYTDFRARLAPLGVDPNDTIMFLVENGPADFSFSPNGSVKSVLDL